MELFIRVPFASIAIFWVWQLISTLRRPSNWTVSTPPESPMQVRLTRNAWLVASFCGIVANLILFTVMPSFLLGSN